MFLIDLSSNVFFSDLNESTDTSIPKILSWFCAHIGDLNIYLGTDLSIVGNEISPELTNDQAIIFGMIYLLRYYQRQITSNLGASGYQVLEVREGDSVVRVNNRTEIAKVYRTLSQDIQNNIDKLSREYKRNKCIPQSINNPLFIPYWSFLYNKQVNPGGPTFDTSI